MDVDFLVSAQWGFFSDHAPDAIRAMGYSCEVFKADSSDPVGGVLRVYGKDGVELVDLMAASWKWQEEITGSPELVEFGKGIMVPVAKLEDLVVLKLKAGGPQDQLDAESLLHAALEAGDLDRARLDSLAKRARVLEKLNKLFEKVK
jgi:hypothetical protein